jgi:hypothetical protein
MACSQDNGMIQVQRRRFLRLAAAALPVVNAAPDGYTLLAASQPNASNATLIRTANIKAE